MATYMDQKAFDAYRQQIWEQGKYLVDTKNGASANNQLTPSMLSTFIISLSTLMASFTDTWQQARRADGANPFFSPGISQEWIDPRYHDYYDFFTNIIRGWEAELQGMTTAQSTIVASLPVTVTNGGSTTQYSSTNTASQADAAGSVQSQPAYIAPPMGMAPTMQPYTEFEQTGFAAPETEKANISPWIIGGLLVGLLFMGRKRRVAA